MNFDFGCNPMRLKQRLIFTIKYQQSTIIIRQSFSHLRKDRLHDASMNVGKAELAALEAVGETLVVDA